MSLEASITKVENGPALTPGRMMKWLDFNYRKGTTKGSYVTTLKNWIIFRYGEDSVGDYLGLKYASDPGMRKRNKEKRIQEIEEGLERYFSELDDRDFLNDLKEFIHWMGDEGYANLTIQGMCSKVKLFFGRQDPRCKIDDDDWKQIKRALLPKSTRAATQDAILTKEQLKRVLQCMSVHGRAMALFLLSTGARIGESCKLTLKDLHLFDNPPWVNIREKYTKGDVGGRQMWFSEEAREAIIEWHEERKTRKKAGDGSWDKNLVFNFKPKVFGSHWNNSLRKADRGKKPAVFARRDPSTMKEIHVYHTHTLRKFFSTNMRLAGVPPDTVHAWMGHQAYLTAAYDRQEYGDLSEIYKDNMHVVTVYEEDLSSSTLALKDTEIEELKAEIARLRVAPIDLDALADKVLARIDRRPE